MTMLAEIQRRVGVPADGVLGPQTLAAILAALDAAKSLSGALRPSQACIDLIKRFEGCKLTAYPDPGTGRDPITIGWGSTRDEIGQPIKRGTVWTQAQADARLADDVAEFAEKVLALLGGADTSQCQFDALVSFAYNLGIGNLRQSTLLEKHKAGDYTGAAAEFARWNKADGKILPGLVKRRAAEATLYAGRAA
jgi:lysozyme